jgi:hypothetical protein
MSSYRRLDFEALFTTDGELAAPIPAHAGVYAPSGVVKFGGDDAGRPAWLLFPAETEWFGQGTVMQERMPWPGWTSVPFQAAQALDRFAHIDDSISAQQFAQTYGPLWICARHRFPCLWRAVNGPDEYRVRHAWSPAESVSDWLFVADHLRKTLLAAGRLLRPEQIPDDDWRALGFGARRPSDQIEARFLLTTLINSYLQKYKVGLHLNDRLELELATGLGFLPALWQQVALAIAGGNSLAVCSNCGQPYLRAQRAPKTGQRNYCGNCQSKRKRDSYRANKTNKGGSTSSHA